MDYGGCDLVTILAAVIFLPTVLILTTLYKRRSPKYKSSIPPGSFGWPLIGETLQFISSENSDNPQSFAQDRRSRFGKVFKTHLFGRRMIVSTDAEINRHVLQGDTTTYRVFTEKPYNDLLGKSFILFLSGTIHKRLHGLIASSVKSPNFKAQYTLHFENCLQESMATWKEDQTIYIQHEISTISLQVLAKALINLDPGEEMDYLKARLQEYVSGLSSLPIKLPGSRLYKSFQAKKKLKEFIYKIIKAKRDGRDYKADSTNGEDLTDMFLKDADLSDEVICNNVVNMMMTTQDNLPMLAALTIRFLSDSPQALQRIMEENIEFKRSHEGKGEESMSWTDYLSLSFTQCVISEALRIGNIISVLIHEVLEDVEINGYLIPKGWCIMTDFRAVHFDENLHESPHQFNPWRWQGKNIGNMISSLNFTPFGGGPRLCAGYELARLQTTIFLHHFVTKFRWVAEEDSIMHFPTGKMKNGMPVRVKQHTDY